VNALCPRDVHPHISWKGIHVSMGEFLVWLGIWSTMLWVVGMLRADFHCRKYVKIFLFPGFFVEAVLRCATCLLTATPILRISPFGENRPFVELGATSVRNPGPPIAICLRLFLFFALLYSLLLSFPAFLHSGFDLPRLEELDISNHGIYWGTFGGFWKKLSSLDHSLRLGAFHSNLLLYLVISYMVAAGFSHQEYMAALTAWVALLLAGAIFSWLGVTFGFLSRGWFIQLLYVKSIWSTFSLLVFLTTVTISILGVVRGTSALLQLLTQRISTLISRFSPAQS
ncbi:MAG: hypothetical protein V3T77_10225, partial [Planctomycetota bacterium]